MFVAKGSPKSEYLAIGKWEILSIGQETLTPSWHLVPPLISERIFTIVHSDHVVGDTVAWKHADPAYFTLYQVY